MLGEVERNPTFTILLLDPQDEEDPIVGGRVPTLTRIVAPVNGPGATMMRANSSSGAGVMLMMLCPPSSNVDAGFV